MIATNLVSSSHGASEPDDKAESKRESIFEATCHVCHDGSSNTYVQDRLSTCFAEPLMNLVVSDVETRKEKDLFSDRSEEP